MFVDYDDDIPPPRQHPWTQVDANPEARYWDLRANPQQIPEVLEDFKPWSHYGAITNFYQMLAWINGDDSIFESNDCGLRPPRRDDAVPEFIQHVFDSDPIVVHGRLTFFFRNLVWNASPQTVDGLKKTIHDGLRNNVGNFPGVVRVGDWAHLFTSIRKEGRAVSLRFWAWGDDEAMAMSNLNGVFEAIHGCLKWISDGVKSRPATG